MQQGIELLLETLETMFSISKTNKSQQLQIPSYELF